MWIDRLEVEILKWQPYDSIYVDKMTQPKLTFFCELPKDRLLSALSDDEVICNLKKLNASLSIGLLDLSVERAEVIKMLNKAGIPVIAWLLLPEEEGYWFNKNNSNKATLFYDKFRDWTCVNDLVWARIGLDVEFDLNIQKQFKASFSHGITTLYKNNIRSNQTDSALFNYHLLIQKIHQDNYIVESYQFPYIVDERKTGSKLLQKILGVLDLKTDYEILMLYSSFMRSISPGTLLNYAKDAQGIGIGSTGGGVEFLSHIPALNWNEFQRDLILAKQQHKDIYIFSLEGCVENGFLPKLINFDWNLPIDYSKTNYLFVKILRAILQFSLWSIAHPIPLLFFLMVLILIIFISRQLL